MTTTTTQAAILCRATADLNSKWLSVIGPDEWRVEEAYNSLEQAVERVKGHFAYDWTFTTRAFDAAIEAYVAQPDDLTKLGLNSHATLLIPEGGGIVNRYVTMHRTPITAAFVVAGVDGKFRPQSMGERILKWFTAQQWRSFAPQKVSERHEPVGQQAHRPHHHRELLVRHGHEWSARDLAPDAFPPLRVGPAITAEQEAKRLAKLPQNRAAARRLKHQQADARFKAAAAERARLREGIA
jgi:hypothetical protein